MDDDGDDERSHKIRSLPEFLFWVFGVSEVDVLEVFPPPLCMVDQMILTHDHPDRDQPNVNQRLVRDLLNDAKWPPSAILVHFKIFQLWTFLWLDDDHTVDDDDDDAVEDREVAAC